MAGGFWSIALIIGPILLIAIIIWAFLRNRAASDRAIDRAERGAAELRDDIESGAPPPQT